MGQAKRGHRKRRSGVNVRKGGQGWRRRVYARQDKGRGQKVCLGRSNVRQVKGWGKVGEEVGQGRG